jgi:TolA-binding protein
MLMTALLSSCKSTNESTLGPELPAWEIDTGDTAAAQGPEDAPLFEDAVGPGEFEEPLAEAPEPERPADENPEVVLPPEVLFEEEEGLGLLEPLVDLAEITEEPRPPLDAPLDSALPEPSIPDFPEVPAETPALSGALPPVQPAPAAPVPISPAPVPPAPALPEARPAPPPAPPPFIRPAEEDTPPPAREPDSRPVLPDSPVRAPPAAIPEPGINFSRVVRATVGQLVEIPFRGSGWVYLGELGSRPGIVYSSRRLDPEGQSFVFRVETPGTYGLKFYKQDFIRDYILNDHVQVIAGEPPEAAVTGWFNPAVDRGRVVAEPRWPSALEEAEARGRDSGAEAGRAAMPAAPEPGAAGAMPPETGGPAADSLAQPPAQRAAAGTQAAGQNAVSADPETARPPVSDDGVVPVRPAAVSGAPQGLAEPQNPAQAAIGDSGAPPETRADSLPSEYLSRARQEFEAGRPGAAISILDQFRERYPSGSDEAWWLYGQFYEAGGPSRDIRTALDYYRRLVREYPQSRRYNDARRRIAYLERYYINIR